MSSLRKLNIVYVIDYLFSVNGGTERQLHRLIKGMVEKGHSVKLYVFRDTEFTKDLEDFECPVESLHIESIGSFVGLKRLIAFRKRLQKDAVHVVHGFFNDVALVFPILFMGSSFRVFTSRRDMGIWYTIPKLLILRSFFWSRVHVICNCVAVARLTESKEWKPANRLSVIYNGIDKYSAEKPVEKTPESLLDKLQETVGKFRVILVANVRPVKGISDLIAAASILDREDVHFFVIGHVSDKKYFKELEFTIKSNGLDACFHFVGPMAEPRIVLNNFDLGVLCSQSEGFSNTLLEYIDAGLPVIASNAGGNPEIIQHEVNGFLYEAGDITGLADSIIKMINDSALRKDFKNRSRNKVSSFSVCEMLERHLKLYR